VALLVAVGVESIQLRRGEDDRNLLPVIHQRGSLAAGASVIKSAHFSTLIRHSAPNAALLHTGGLPVHRTSESLGSSVASRPSSAGQGRILYGIPSPDETAPT
jgi:hypothetical protein